MLDIGDDGKRGMAGKRFDYSFANTSFWWFYILYNMYAHDNERKINLDEAIHDIVGPDPVGSLDWYLGFCPKNEADRNGLLPNPHCVVEKLTDTLTFAVEFHFSKTNYFINDIYIGNHGGHFEMWFLTWEELLAFERFGGEVFMLLLTMTGISEEQRLSAEAHISQRLKSLPMFAEHSDYIARCICNGLLMEGDFDTLKDVGLTNRQNHSLRNVVKYAYYRDNVALLNTALWDFCHRSM
ncbi:MAG: Imm19 family immunity protein [Peptococcaceae bacterium]|nr:Imm19 family immunity protein [Peptococcaceae bacterium]